MIILSPLTQCHCNHYQCYSAIWNHGNLWGKRWRCSEEQNILVRTYVIAFEYDLFFFSAIFLASCFVVLVADGPEGKHEQNEVTFLTSSLRCSYHRHFNYSWYLHASTKFFVNYLAIELKILCRRINGWAWTPLAIRFKIYYRFFICGSCFVVIEGIALKQLKSRLSLNTLANVLHDLSKGVSDLAVSHVYVTTHRTVERIW